VVMMCADREYGGADVTGADPDLVYDGRLVKRPPGASEETQEIYRLLHEHPDGMTIDEIHDGLRDGWMATDVYRAYARSRETDRARARKFYADKTGGARPRTQQTRGHLEYGTPAFKEAAQRRAISRSLQDMKRLGSARRVGTGSATRWFAGRPPKVPGSSRPSLVPFDPVKSREVLTSTTREHVDRELVKADLLAVLNDKRVKGKTRDRVQSAYNRLCGRS
jgi:hypothetical protein